MKEAQERCVSWEETDEQTFIRFSQFAYTGDYNGVEPSSDHGGERRVGDEENVRVDWGDWGGKKKKKLRSDAISFEESKRESSWDRFKKLYPDPDANPYGNSPHDDYTEVFLSHARLYVFADYHGIAAPQTHSLRKLHRILIGFIPYEKRVGDIVELVRYCYENTVDRGEESDALRSLVNSYTACKVEELWKCQAFRALLETIGEYSKGLVAEMLHRLN